jgi:hypothetical protein
MKILILLIFLISCAQEGIKDPRDGKGIEQEFLPYVEAFEEACKTKVIDIPINFEYNMDIKHVGYCQVFSQGKYSFKQIKIDPDFWYNSTPSVKAWLIYHELGHCHFNLGHDDSVNENKEPANIMYPYIIFNAKKLLSQGYLTNLCKMGGTLTLIDFENLYE